MNEPQSQAQSVLSEQFQALPFSKPRQEALLGWLLRDEKFFTQARLKLKKEWFLDPRCGQVYAAELAEGQRLGRKPTPEEVKECREFQKAEQREREILCNTINRAVSRTGDFGLDSITPELTDWLHARIYVEKVAQSTTLFNSAATAIDHLEKRKRAFSLLRDMSREIEEITFDPGVEESFDDWAKDLENIGLEIQNSLSFGISAMDQLLLPDAGGKGSLLRGDTTILLAPTNIGKTTAMITILTHNIKMGKNVLLLTHEGRPSDIKLKIMQAMTGLTRTDLLRLYCDPQWKPAFQEIAALLRRRLVYVPLMKAGLTVEEVAVVVQRQIDKFAVMYGEAFDLIVDDYLAILNTEQNGRGNLQKRQADEVIYKYGVQMALQHKAHFLTAIQTNRDGSKTNKQQKGQEKRLIGMEDVMESWGPMTAATNVISINRDPVAMARGRVTYYICKSRSSEVGWAVVCKSNYPCCITHHEELGATWYRGTSPMTERIDVLLDAYRGKAIPEEKVLSSDVDDLGADD